MYVLPLISLSSKNCLTITSCRLFSHLPQGLCSTTSSTSSSLSSPECSCGTSFIPSAILPAIILLHSRRTATLLSYMADGGRTVKRNFRTSEDWVRVWVHNNSHIWHTYCLLPLSVCLMAGSCSEGVPFRQPVDPFHEWYLCDFFYIEQAAVRRGYFHWYRAVHCLLPVVQVSFCSHFAKRDKSCVPCSARFQTFWRCRFRFHLVVPCQTTCKG